MDIGFFREVLSRSLTLDSFVEDIEDYYMDVVLESFGLSVVVSFVPYDNISNIRGGFVGIKVDVTFNLGEYTNAPKIYQNVYDTLIDYFESSGIIARQKKLTKNKNRDTVIYSQVFLLRYLLTIYKHEYEQENNDGTISLINYSPFERLK